MGREVGEAQRERTMCAPLADSCRVWQVQHTIVESILQLKINKYSLKSFSFCSTVQQLFLMCYLLCLSIKVLVFFEIFSVLALVLIKKI